MPGFEIGASMQPAKAIGGDLYDFMEMPNERLGIVIADIGGKGVSAGLLMPAVNIALRTTSVTKPASNGFSRKPTGSSTN